MDPSKDPRRSAERDEERYLLGKELGRGGIGRVVLAVDRKLLGREVAMKLLAPARRTGRTLRLASGKTPPERVRFFEEARITAQLSHPNIVPVHDLGTRPSGEAFYTMGVVRGRTLSAEIHAVHRRLADGTLPRDDWSVERTRLVQALQGTCHAIAYAHSRGIVHRDIKPANVMLGDFGETIVLDWGLAKVIGPRGARVPRKRAPRRPRREIGDGPATFETVAFDDGEWTVEGTVIGTPSYMSPEQAHGRIAEIDELSDVFSLGAVLFELLAGRPPFVGLSLLETLIAARKCDVPDVRALAGAPVPEDLAQICERALAPRKSERFPGVDAMVREITLAMDGARERRRMRERCRDALGRARVLVASYHEAIEDAARARAAHAAIARDVVPYDPLEGASKSTLLEATRAMEVATGRTDASFNAALVALAEALVFDPRDPEARREMGEFHYVHMTRAEREQRWKDRDFHQGQVAFYNDGVFDARLEGDGTLTLATRPSRAEVALYRYEERGWILEPAFVRALGKTPLSRVPIPMGSYLLLVNRTGFRETRVPILVGRLEEVVLEVPLYTDEQIGDSMVYVPPGPFLMGEGTARRRVDLPGFFVARLPVTFAAYCEYLDWLQENAPDDVARHAPRDAVNGRFVQRDSGGRFRALDPLPPPGTSGVMDPEIPVMSVSWYSAVAYAGWRSMMDDRRYDLPAEAEWEKAARGTDGRAYPWGNRFDPTLCKMARTRPGVAQPAPAGLFPHNVSPYGMGEAAGGVFNWTLDWFDDSQQWKVVRGGSWGQDEASCRTFTRQWGEPAAGYSSHGIRLCSRQPASSRTKRGRR